LKAKWQRESVDIKEREKKEKKEKKHHVAKKVGYSIRHHPLILSIINANVNITTDCPSKRYQNANVRIKKTPLPKCSAHSSRTMNKAMRFQKKIITNHRDKYVTRE